MIVLHTRLYARTNVMSKPVPACYYYEMIEEIKQDRSGRKFTAAAYWVICELRTNIISSD